MRLLLILLVILPLQALAGERERFLDLARKGWVYELRSAMFPRRPGMPPVLIHGRSLAGATICMLGEAPHARTRAVLDGFSALMRDVHGRPTTMRRARVPRDCGPGAVVHLRLYSTRSPVEELREDMRQLDETYAIGFSPRQLFRVISPAQGQTLFGRNGNATHLLVQQPHRARLTPLEERFFASILLEELYQAFTFGMDILHLDRAAAFVSKLEELPVDLRGADWRSPRFMEGILQTNPPGLCRFDVFMLHAVAAAPMDRTNDQAFLAFIDAAYDDLSARAETTMGRLAGAGILDPACAPMP